MNQNKVDEYLQKLIQNVAIVQDMCHDRSSFLIPPLYDLGHLLNYSRCLHSRLEQGFHFIFAESDLWRLASGSPTNVVIR